MSAIAAESEWTFTGWAGPPVAVRMFVPEVGAETAPVVIVMHGASRDAPRYFGDWKALAAAQDFIVVVPFFSKQHFPGAERYNLGYVFDPDTGRERPREKWTFAAIEPLFDEVVRQVGGEQSAYTIYGHSAGGQFVHRFMYYEPQARARQFIAANAGWYTLPDFGIEYPYGLLGSGIADDALAEIFSKKLILLLGRDDTDVNADKLRKTPEAERQGPNRLARGNTMYRVAASYAGKRDMTFNWKLLTIDGADHDNAKMAPSAAALIDKASLSD